MYAILPATPVNNLLSEKCTAILKSVICACPRSSRRMLSGFKSLLDVRIYNTKEYPPMHDPFGMEVVGGKGDLGDVESHGFLVQCARSIKVN